MTTQLPFPPKSGGTVKSWNYVKHLSSNYELSIACLLKDDDAEHVEAFKAAISISNFYYEELDVKRSALNLIKSYLQSACLNVFRNYSKSFLAKINGLAKEYDTLIIDHYEMFQYVPENYHGRVVMHTHNAEFMLWQRMSELSNHPIKKFILFTEAKRVKKYESYIFKNSDLIYSTPSDIELYKQHGFDVSKHDVTYHLGNDQLLSLPELKFSETEKAISFMGTLSWEPNIDGLVWFLEKVWPLIVKKDPEVVFYIMGKDPDSRIIQAISKDQRIKLTGFIENLDDYLKKTRAYIAPLRFGSGMKVKVLEGLYRGVPCVSTSVGAEGLELENEKHIFINDDEYQFASYCLKLLQDDETWEKLSSESRKVAAEKYLWKDLFKRMDQSLSKIS